MSKELELKLFKACEKGELPTIRELVEKKGVNASAVDERAYHLCQGWYTEGWTPLHYCCVEGHLEVAEYLLTKCDADVNGKSDRGFTPLHYASAEGKLEIVKWLVQNTDVSNIINLKEKIYGLTPLGLARRYGHPDVVLWLISNAKFSDDDLNATLRWASEKGHVEIVTYLVEHTSIDVNSRDCQGRTSLDLAREYSHADVVLGLISNVKFNVDDLNVTLRWASEYGHADVVLWLISNVKFNVDDLNVTLRWASEKGKMEIVRHLVEHTSIDVNSRDCDGRTSLDLAQEYRNDQVAEFVSEYVDKQREFDTSARCGVCEKKYAFYRRKYKCRNCWAAVCDNCSKHKLFITDTSSKPQRVCDTCFNVLLAQRKIENTPLSADELRILNIVLVEYLDKLKDVGLCFETDQPASHRPATDLEPVITKKTVVEGLQRIGQHRFAEILSKKQGIKKLQDYVYETVYESALRSEKAEVRLQAFKMILSGVPRSGKTTFWKRLAMKDFQPTETSTSTGVAESHFLSAHMNTEMLLDLHLYSETDTSDLKTEALTIYKHIIEAAPTQSDSNQSESVVPAESSPVSPKEEHELTSISAKSEDVQDEQPQATTYQSPCEEYDSSIYETTLPDDNQQSEAANQISTMQKSLPVASEGSRKVQVKYAYRDIIDEQLLEAQKKEIEEISKEIEEYFDELTSFLRKGEKVPANIPLIKKICHLIDTGSQRAFLELLPTVTVGKALYLLFFSYEHFEKTLQETVQQKGIPGIEAHTGVYYEQMDVVMQSLICVSTTSSRSRDNVALLVGTHVDKVKSQHVKCVNDIVAKKVEPFLKSSLVFAEKEKMVLEVSIKKNKRCSNRPEDYRKVIMNLVDKRLSCPESEKLPPSWYMFSIVLRRMKLAGRSVLQYSHCQQIARKLYIKEAQLQSLLSRLHKILGVVMYFPEVHGLKDIVICDPYIAYRGISQLIFKSFDETLHPKLSLPLKKMGSV